MRVGADMMKRFKKYGPVYLVMGFVLSIAGIVYGSWSLAVFRSGPRLAEMQRTPFFHPWQVWSKVARSYMERTGNTDPAAAAEFVSNLMFTEIFLGILLLIVCIIFAVIMLIRKSEDVGVMRD